MRLPKARAFSTCPLFEAGNLSSTFIPPYLGKNRKKQDCLFHKALGPILQKRTQTKREKRILSKSSEDFQNFPFLPIINTIFPFAPSSPLWHSWYIFLPMITSFKAPPPCYFTNPLDCAVMAGAAFMF